LFSVRGAAAVGAVMFAGARVYYRTAERAQSHGVGHVAGSARRTVRVRGASSVHHSPGAPKDFGCGKQKIV